MYSLLGQQPPYEKVLNWVWIPAGFFNVILRFIFRYLHSTGLVVI